MEKNSNLDYFNESPALRNQHLLTSLQQITNLHFEGDHTSIGGSLKRPAVLDRQVIQRQWVRVPLEPFRTFSLNDFSQQEYEIF